MKSDFRMTSLDLSVALKYANVSRRSGWSSSLRSYGHQAEDQPFNIALHVKTYFFLKKLAIRLSNQVGMYYPAR